MARMNKREQDEVLGWVQEHRSCAICWWPESDGRRTLDVHHLMSGSARKHDVRQYVRLCHRCHDLFHAGRVVGNFPPLYKGTLLWAKQESDPDNYDPQYLASLRRKQHLGYDPEPPHQFYLDERQRNLGRSRRP